MVGGDFGTTTGTVYASVQPLALSMLRYNHWHCLCFGTTTGTVYASVQPLALSMLRYNHWHCLCFGTTTGTVYASVQPLALSMLRYNHWHCLCFGTTTGTVYASVQPLALSMLRYNHWHCLCFGTTTGTVYASVQPLALSMLRYNHWHCLCFGTTTGTVYASVQPLALSMLRYNHWHCLCFGTTTGTVYAGFMPSTKSHAPSLKPEHQFAQTIINSKLCTDMNYTLYSNQTKEQLYLTVEETSQDEAMAYYNKKKDLQGDIVQYHSNERVNAELLFTPVFITVTLQSCPPGFTLLGDPPGCDCYPALTEREVKCDFINGTGYISWNGPMWLNMNTNFTDQIVIAQYCPSEHCQTGEKMVSLQDDPDAQCVFNHAGRLCGGCKENYSLALGSSHCIYCPKNNYLALLIWFAAAGVLLVFVIAAFNLTVTEGMINGLIFYANIVWAYRGIVFPQPTETNVVQSFLKVFVAWINLDFGIQTCFFDGLTAFWKTWLQFVFPIYTAGLFIIFLLLCLTTLLLCYMNYQHVYKSKSVMILESSFLINLILLVGVVLYYSNKEEGSVAIQNACTLCIDGRCIH